jgi:hypothetical protein
MSYSECRRLPNGCLTDVRRSISGLAWSRLLSSQVDLRTQPGESLRVGTSETTRAARYDRNQPVTRKGGTAVGKLDGNDTPSYPTPGVDNGRQA